MHYMEILVASATYHGDGALTYSYHENLAIGTIVTIPLRNTLTLGIVYKIVSKPRFAAKSVTSRADLPPLPSEMIHLMLWLKAYYPSPFGVITQQFLPKQLPRKPVEVSAFTAMQKNNLPPLTSDQAQALGQITDTGTYILHGETGTGKTRVYIELAKKSLEEGRSSIILTPEIGLTSQLARSFREVFGERVVVIHSQLTDVTRQRLWVYILKQTSPLVIVGPRSALFSPLKRIGFIAIDESHETAYKQDQAPYHHASRVASKLISLHRGILLLGSATPLVSDYYMAKTKRRPIIRMEQTAVQTKSDNKNVSIIDLKDRTKFTRKSHLSDELIAAVNDNLKHKEQTLLFLNRRGTARVIFCEECAWQATCPHCDLPLVYHGDTHSARCHSCDYKSLVPVSCPDCHHASVVFKSIGTKALVDEAIKLFPDARIMRFDTDNQKHERIEQHYDAVVTGDVDIIIGTQTLTKGLDLPRLSLVGVVIADTSLYFPDFSAQERTYQLLRQVIGRVGRGHISGRSIIQTYAPDSPLLKSILSKDWDTFYNKEIKERSTFLFPPFCYLLKLTCKRASSSAAEKAAQSLIVKLKTANLRIAIEGPAPSFHEKALGKYQWQIVIKAKDRSQLLNVIGLLPSGWSYDIDPLNLL